jgi:hypothetical protein
MIRFFTMHFILMLVDCPMGTYSQSSQCVLCPIGTYQDETEQTFCKPCPSGFTTNIEGSKNESDCSGNLDIHHIKYLQTVVDCFISLNHWKMFVRTYF